MGHARAILGLPTEDMQRDVAQRAAAEGLSVRQVERVIQAMTSKREAAPIQQAKEPNV
jgi:ParB family chromosome partitioning protein